MLIIGIDPGISGAICFFEDGEIKEVIFALSSTMEAETTIFYLYKLLLKYKVIISVIAKGISVGDELEYTDELTLGRSIMKRVPYESSA